MLLRSIVTRTERTRSCHHWKKKQYALNGRRLKAHVVVRPQDHHHPPGSSPGQTQRSSSMDISNALYSTATPLKDAITHSSSLPNGISHDSATSHASATCHAGVQLLYWHHSGLQGCGASKRRGGGGGIRALLQVRREGGREGGDGERTMHGGCVGCYAVQQGEE